MSNVKTLNIPASVTSIGTYAFHYCSNMDAVRMDSQTPPVVGTNGLYSSPICYVPVGCLEAYQAADWASMVSRFEESEQEATCAQAARVSTLNPSLINYTIHGYVTEITQEYSSTNNHVSFWMADMPTSGKVLLACEMIPVAEADQVLKVGDYVEVKGYVVSHNAMPSLVAGSSVEIISAPTSVLCGDNLHWTLLDSVLTISGTGAMYDYASTNPAPWDAQRAGIKNVIVKKTTLILKQT